LLGGGQLLGVGAVDLLDGGPPHRGSGDRQHDGPRDRRPVAEQAPRTPAERNGDEEPRQGDEDEKRQRHFAAGGRGRDEGDEREQQHPPPPHDERGAEMRAAEDHRDQPAVVVAVRERVVQIGRERSDEDRERDEGERDRPPAGHGEAQMM
jgi:hypothetical protein